jgi:hypothetical protein
MWGQSESAALTDGTETLCRLQMLLGSCQQTCTPAINNDKRSKLQILEKDTEHNAQYKKAIREKTKLQCKKAVSL